MNEFKRVLIDKENKCEACSVADFNNDGKPEILCGEYMYSGDGFASKTKICDITYDGAYLHDFSDYPLDANGDGRLDIITGSWWSEGLYWRENPKKAGAEWKTHKIEATTNIETIRYFDIDNCGTVEIFPNTPGEPQSFFKLTGPGEFKRYTISEGASGHGMGFGDVNGDGKTDIILANGWLENPGDCFAPGWKFHEFKYTEPFGGAPGASVPILVYDVDGDGINDIIIGAGHGFGLWWLQQTADGEFIPHEIDMKCSQYHDMQLFDIDNDGELELVTGARRFAHCDYAPGEHNPIGTYIFKIKKTPAGCMVFDKTTLDYGPAEAASGVGIYFWIEDLTGSGLKDIVAPGKEGLYIFYNQ